MRIARIQNSLKIERFLNGSGRVARSLASTVVMSDLRGEQDPGGRIQPVTDGHGELDTGQWTVIRTSCSPKDTLAGTFEVLTNRGCGDSIPTFSLSLSHLLSSWGTCSLLRILHWTLVGGVTNTPLPLRAAIRFDSMLHQRNSPQLERVCKFLDFAPAQNDGNDFPVRNSWKTGNESKADNSSQRCRSLILWVVLPENPATGTFLSTNHDQEHSHPER